AHALRPVRPPQLPPPDEPVRRLRLPLQPDPQMRKTTGCASCVQGAPEKGGLAISGGRHRRDRRCRHPSLPRRCCLHRIATAPRKQSAASM
ncbi:hypothetical protein Taro_000395, partial [Colocasia esculenta]|nr:hypothetical protein [Colocasia esculenta]